MVTERTPQRLVQAILKTTKQRIMSGAMMICCESALDLCGDLAIIGDTNNTTEDSVAEDNASSVDNKKEPHNKCCELFTKQPSRGSRREQ